MFDMRQEYRSLSNDRAIDWNRLEGATVLVTGATGLIGSCVVRALLEHNHARSAAPVHVVAMVRSLEKARDVFAEYANENSLEYLVQDVLEPLPQTSLDYIIHTACPTASSFFTSHPLETADAIVLGTRQLLEYARTSGVRSMVYVSSMEVYGEGNPTRGLEHMLTESQVGSSDVMNARSCYPEGKRMAETYCAAYASEYDVKVATVRLAQTFGPGIPKTDARLFAMIARAAMQGEDVVLKTTGESTRMYVYTLDAVAAILIALLQGKSGQAYNVANQDTYSSVKEMAEMVLDQFGDRRGKVIIDVDPNAPYPPEHHLPLDCSQMRELGWVPKVGLNGMYRNLIAYLESA